MKIEVDGHIIQIKPISYVDRLGLQGEFADVYANGTDNVSQKKFNLLLGHTAEIAFNNPDDSLKEYPYEVQLKILTNIMSEYLGLSDNQKIRWGLSYAVWYWFLQPDAHEQLILPYSCLNPITNEQRDFETLDDIWQVIIDVVNAHDPKRTFGAGVILLTASFCKS